MGGKRPAQYQGIEAKRSKVVHHAKTAYVTFIWGCHLTHILECLFLGMQLKRVSTVRRICYVAIDEVPLRPILTMLWEIRTFHHLDLKKYTNRRAGTSERLSKVYSKLQLGNLDACDIEVAILLDTDIWVKSNLVHLLGIW